MTALAGWSLRWAGDVLLGHGPDGEGRSLGEVDGTTAILLTPSGATLLEEDAGDPQAARDRIERVARAEGADVQSSWGAWCRARRVALGLTQARLGELARVNPLLVSALEGGKERQRGYAPTTCEASRARITKTLATIPAPAPPPAIPPDEPSTETPSEPGPPALTDGGERQALPGDDMVDTLPPTTRPRRPLPPDVDALLPASRECEVCGNRGSGCPECRPALHEGAKLDTEKPRWDLLPVDSVAQVVSVLTYGARKYAPYNWQHVPDARRRYYAAALRHLTAWWSGERVDPESGHPHLAHAACCLLFLLWFER